MRRSSIIACLLLVVSALTAWSLLSPVQNHLKPNPVKTDSAGIERDILSEITGLNNETNAPSVKFRTGHVTPTTLKDYFKKTDYGFSISLPSNTNIPTPAVNNGNVYVSGGFGSKEYYAFDAYNGNLKWAISLDDDGPSAAAIEDGTIVFNTESCTIFACDLVTGKQLWSYYLGDPLMSMPSISNGMVFTSYPASYPGKGRKNNVKGINIQPSHVLIAIELKTGKILWQKWIDSDIMSAPVAKNNLLYVTTFSGALYKFVQKTGEILEAKAMRATSAPVFSNDDQVIVSQRNDGQKDEVAKEVIVMGNSREKKKIYEKQAAYLDHKVQSKTLLKNKSSAMDAGNGFASGAPSASNYSAAEFNIGQSNVSSLQSFQGSRGLYNKGQLYTTMGDEILCTDSSGKLIWKYQLNGDMKNEGGFMGTPPVYANGFIIVATLTGDVLIIDEKLGKIFKKYELNDPVRYQPVVENGWIYVTSVNSRMHAINTGNMAITGWNMWGGNAGRTNVGR